MTQTRPTSKLSLRQQAALMATQSLLEAGLLAHKSDDDDTEAPKDACFFNMNYWIEEQGRQVDYTDEEDEDGEPVVKHCGSFMCIGGTTEWLLGRKEFAGESPLMAVADADPGLYDLFYPGQTNGLNKPEFERAAVGGYNWNNINPQQAAKAIENYRMSGDPKWYEVLGLDRE